MSVTRKHFRWAAEYIQHEVGSWGDNYETLTKAFVAFFKAHNKQFDERRFEDYITKCNQSF